jgi:hypothetical protein
VAARAVGKYLGAMLSLRVGPAGLPSPREMSLALVPQSPASIVLIVAAAMLYSDPGDVRIRWSITAIIVGGVLTELVIRMLQGGGPSPEESLPALAKYERDRGAGPP